MVRRGNRFERGSGCYKCQSCGRTTRATGRGDNEFTKLCAECYDLAGLENYISDNCADVTEVPESIKIEVNNLYHEIVTKGGTPQFEYMTLITPPKGETP